MTGYMYQLSYNDILATCNERDTCEGCPLMFEGGVCLKDLSDRGNRNLRKLHDFLGKVVDYDSIRRVTKIVGEEGEAGRSEEAKKHRKVFSEDETLAVINEKARLRGMSYGQYVLERENGKYSEDRLMQPDMSYEHRTQFCRVRKRR